jgi:asparagine synthase (glutamine-hydrolysing)
MLRISGLLSKNKRTKFTTNFFDKNYTYKKIYNINREYNFKFIVHSKKKIDFSDYVYENNDLFVFSFDSQFILNLKKNKNKIFFFKDFSSAILFQKKKFILKRNIFSSNTIYFSKKKNNFYFSSEIKTILENYKKITLCKKVLVNFLCRNYRMVWGRGYTFFNEIYEIKAANYINFLSNPLIQKNYWMPSLKNNFSNKPIQDFKNSLLQIIESKLKNFKKPIFLVSGGLDSTIIAAFAKKILKKKIDTISAVFKNSKKFDESFYIKRFTKEVSRKKIFVSMTNASFVKFLKVKEKEFDQPLISPVYLLMNFIFNTVKNKKYDAIFGGGGGDILSMGCYEYQPYIFADYLKLSKKKYLKQIFFWHKVQKNFIRNWPTDNYNMIKLINLITQKNGKIFHNPDWVKANFEILNKKFFSGNDLKFIPHINFKFPKYIQSRIADELFSQAIPTHFIEELNLSKYNLEGCDPFLNKDLFEKCFNMSLENMTSKGYTKVLFRKVSKGILPEIVRLRKDKTGLSIPIDDWFIKGALNKYFKKLLENTNNKKILNIEYLKKILKDHELRLQDNSWLLWRALSFMIWKKNYNEYF